MATLEYALCGKNFEYMKASSVARNSLKSITSTLLIYSDGQCRRQAPLPGTV